MVLEEKISLHRFIEAVVTVCACRKSMCTVVRFAFILGGSFNAPESGNMCFFLWGSVHS